MKKEKNPEISCEKKHKKMNGVTYVLGSVVLAAVMFKIMPKVIDVGSAYLYKKHYYDSAELEDDDWGPEIVKNSDLEEN